MPVTRMAGPDERTHAGAPKGWRTPLFSCLRPAGDGHILHDEAGREIGAWVNGAFARKYIYDAIHVAPVANVAADGTLTYNLLDRLGSVVGVVDATGTSVPTQYAYLPFGDSAPPNIGVCAPGTCGSGTGTAFGFAGYRYDPETGLYHAGARYYDPRMGRFIQPDPIGQEGGLNLYAYVGNDPLNRTDPTGLFAKEGASGLFNLLAPADPNSYAAVRAVSLARSSAALAVGLAAEREALLLPQVSGQLEVHMQELSPEPQKVVWWVPAQAASLVTASGASSMQHSMLPTRRRILWSLRTEQPYLFLRRNRSDTNPGSRRSVHWRFWRQRTGPPGHRSPTDGCKQ